VVSVLVEYLGVAALAAEAAAGIEARLGYAAIAGRAL